MGQSLIEVEQFGKDYGSRPLLRGISFDVARGEMVGLIGKSACGKSTVLRHLACLEGRETGEIYGKMHLNLGLLNGGGGSRLDLLRLPESLIRRQGIRGRIIGMVFQHDTLFDFLSVGSNLEWPLKEATSLDWRERRSKVAAVLELVDMPTDQPFLNRPVTRLSGGERRRLALARTLALDPAIMLYDEPTTGLDPPTVREVTTVMNRFKEQGLTGIITSHDMATVRAVADRVGMVRDGGLAFFGPAAEAEREPLLKAFMAGSGEPLPE
jgi:ABC-type transporter Mla maintaining outer membrane lipid asymmetry ATPase subunit MlaF